MPRIDVTEMPFSKLYPLLVNNAEKKGRTRQEVDQVTAWLTGYTPEDNSSSRQGDGRQPHCPLRSPLPHLQLSLQPPSPNNMEYSKNIS